MVEIMRSTRSLSSVLICIGRVSKPALEINKFIGRLPCLPCKHNSTCCNNLGKVGLDLFLGSYFFFVVFSTDRLHPSETKERLPSSTTDYQLQIFHLCQALSCHSYRLGHHF